MPKKIQENCKMCWRQESKLIQATHIISTIYEGKEIQIKICDKHFNSIFGIL